MLEVLDFIFLLVLVIAVIVGVILGGILALAATAVAWGSLILTIGHGTRLDIGLGSLYVVFWMMTATLIFSLKVWPDRSKLHPAQALAFGYFPQVLILFMMEHVSLSITGLLVIWLLNDKSVYTRLPPEFFERRILTSLLYLQAAVALLITRSPFAIPYFFMVWWWIRVSMSKEALIKTERDEVLG
ncbi:hypothetical protein [Thermococcus celer]|uniref:Uncharacterized protein n=1 Tax=Thermococcus celer Vu 13 = JCM 8558 TaxID=1293037 RepID=A0A218P4C3_THECE|nr:hypothetical protein [Thermococcus celer]ASI99777.1 hypothetical protein A3L02_09475 [Thermococcus celer Vu 13 = JCM 8558]